MKWAAAAFAGALALLAGGALLLWGAVAFLGMLPFGRHAAAPSPPPDDPAVIEYDLTGGCRFVHFGPDGPRVVLANPDDATPFARVYDLNTGRAVTPAHQTSYQSPTFSPDGRWVVSVGAGPGADVWSASTGGSLSPGARPDDWFNAANGAGAFPDILNFATFSPGGKRVLTAYGSLGGLPFAGGILGGPPGGAPINPVAGVPPAAAPANPPGGCIGGVSNGALGGQPGAGGPVGGNVKGKALVCNAVTGKALTPPLEHDGGVVMGMFSPDGRRVVTAGDDGAARVWNAADGRPVSPLLPHGGLLLFVAFSPDGAWVVTAGDDKMARVWDAVTGEPVCPSFNHGDMVHHAVFSPDGKKVVTSSEDKTARVWDVATGLPVTPPLQHDGAVSWAVFSPDGKMVATAGADSMARVWDAATGEPISPPLMHGAAVEHVAFSPDGRQVVTESQDHTARLWDVATGEELKTVTIGPE